MCVCQCECLWILGKGHPEEAISFAGAAVIGGYEMLEKGAGNLTRVLWKNNRFS